VIKTRFEGLSEFESADVNDGSLTRNISGLVQTARSADPRGIYSILGMMGLGYSPFPQPAPAAPRPTLPLSAEEIHKPAQSTPGAPALRKGAAN
jgi:hypothetical protein